MSLHLIVSLTLALLLVSLVAVAWLGRSRRPVSKPVEPVRPQPVYSVYRESVGPIEPDRPQSVYREDDYLFWIEYGPMEELKGYLSLSTATAKVQADLLAAGDVLLVRLSLHASECLKRPILCEKLDLFMQGGDPDCLMPERVRAAMGMAEVVRVIRELMAEFYLLEFGKTIGYVGIDERSGDILVGKRRYAAKYMVGRLSKAVEVTEEIAVEMWARIGYIIRDDLAIIPGIRKKKAEVFGKTSAG